MYVPNDSLVFDTFRQLVSRCMEYRYHWITDGNADANSIPWFYHGLKWLLEIPGGAVDL